MTLYQPQTVQGELAGPPVRALTRTYENGTIVLPHRHERGQIVYAVSGVMEMSAGSDLWIIPPQRALWMPPHLVHSLRAMGTVELRTVFRATEPKRLRMISGGHFAPYVDQFEAASSEALAWFTAHLCPAR